MGWGSLLLQSFLETGTHELVKKHSATLSGFCCFAFRPHDGWEVKRKAPATCSGTGLVLGELGHNSFVPRATELRLTYRNGAPEGEVYFPTAVAVTLKHSGTRLCLTPDVRPEREEAYASSVVYPNGVVLRSYTPPLRNLIMHFEIGSAPRTR